MAFRVRRIHKDAIIPTKAHKLDAGHDIYSISLIDIPAWSQAVIETGLELVELPDAKINGYWATGLFLWPRSGLDAKCALTTGAGVVDFIYRGKILVLLKNQSDVHIHVPYGKAIAQAVIHPVWIGDVEEVGYSGESERGKSGENKMKTKLATISAVLMLVATLTTSCAPPKYVVKSVYSGDVVSISIERASTWGSTDLTIIKTTDGSVFVLTYGTPSVKIGTKTTIDTYDNGFTCVRIDTLHNYGEDSTDNCFSF